MSATVINILKVYSKSWKMEFKRKRNRSSNSKRAIWKKLTFLSVYVKTTATLGKNVNEIW